MKIEYRSTVKDIIRSVALNSINVSDPGPSEELDLVDVVAGSFHPHGSCHELYHVPKDLRCTWARENEHCFEGTTIIKYVPFLICNFTTSTVFIGIILLLLFLVILFIILGTVADEFFCPNLEVIAKSLNLSEATAGVTILAFGNGSPDIFTSLAGIPRDHIELIFCELIGGGIFITTVLVGTICINHPLNVAGRILLRDVLFYLVSVGWTYYTFSKHYVTVYDTSGYIIIYAVYLLAVICDKYFRQIIVKRASLLISENELERLRRIHVGDREGLGSQTSSKGSGHGSKGNSENLNSKGDDSSSKGSIHKKKYEKKRESKESIKKKPDEGKSGSRESVRKKHDEKKHGSKESVRKKSDEKSADQRSEGSASSGKSKSIITFDENVQYSEDEVTKKSRKWSDFLQIWKSDKEDEKSERTSLCDVEKNTTTSEATQQSLDVEKNTTTSEATQQSLDFKKMLNNWREFFRSCCQCLTEDIKSHSLLGRNENLNSKEDDSSSKGSIHKKKDEKKRESKESVRKKRDEKKPGSKESVRKKSDEKSADQRSEGSASSGKSKSIITFDENVQYSEVGEKQTEKSSDGEENSEKSNNWREFLNKYCQSKKDDSTQPLLGEVKLPPKSVWWDFLHAINPITKEEWEISSCWFRFVLIIKSPAVFFLKLTVPVVTIHKPMRGWCKPLSVLLCITLPLYIVSAYGYYNHRITKYKFPLILIILTGGKLCSLIVFCTSRRDKEPLYHTIFSFLGFLGSVFTVYTAANEVVNLMWAVGIVGGISEATLGLTVLSWGTQLGDFISILALVRAGYERMGFVACFGGSLFNVIMSIGLAFTVAAFGAPNRELAVNYGKMGTICLIFLAISLMSSLIAFPAMRFRTRVCFGKYLYVLYTLFLGICLLNEFNVIKLPGNGVESTRTRPERTTTEDVDWDYR